MVYRGNKNIDNFSLPSVIHVAKISPLFRREPSFPYPSYDEHMDQFALDNSSHKHRILAVPQFLAASLAFRLLVHNAHTASAVRRTLSRILLTLY